MQKRKLGSTNGKDWINLRKEWRQGMGKYKSKEHEKDRIGKVAEEQERVM